MKIECGARSDAWPADEKSIRPCVADVYPETITDAAVPLKVLSIERTFWEKATILHAEAHRDQIKATPTRFSRHYADLAALADHASAAGALARDDCTPASSSTNGSFSRRAGKIRNGCAGNFSTGAAGISAHGLGKRLPFDAGNVFRAAAHLAGNRQAVARTRSCHQRPHGSVSTISLFALKGV